MANKITHIEFMGADGIAQKDFYSAMFGWETEAVPGFEQYFLVPQESSGGPGAAVGRGPDESPSYLTVYIEVDSIDDQLEKIAAAGGSTITPRTVVPDVVTFAMFADPAGNLVGLLEPDSPSG